MTHEPTPDLTHESVNGELVVFDPASQQVHLLNDEAAQDYLALDVPSRRRFLQATTVIGGAAVATLVLPKLSAAASTVSGSLTNGGSVATYGDSSFTPNYSPGSGFVFVENHAPYKILQAGSVTSWSTKGFGGTGALVILRATAVAGRYTCVYSSAVQTLPTTSRLSTYTLPAPVAVQAGDFVGCWANATMFSNAYASDTSEVSSTSTPPAAGSTVLISQAVVNGYRNSVSATVV